MYKTILVPLDGSARAETIIPHVEAVAHQNHAKVIFVKVLVMDTEHGPYGEPFFNSSAIEQERDQSITYLSGWKDKFIDKGFDADYVTLYGDPAKKILSVAETHNADLIAIASHGRTGLSRIFLGSVAAGILHQTDRPLLLIRSQDTTE